MALEDALAGIGRRPTGTRCAVAELLDRVPEAERASVLAAVLDKDKPQEGVARVLTDHGYPIGSNSIGRHRRRACQCP